MMALLLKKQNFTQFSMKVSFISLHLGNLSTLWGGFNGMKKVIPAVLAGGLVMTAGGTAFAATGSDILNSGSKYLGAKYVYGAPIGSTNSFDCSSFTATVFKKYGINLPRVAADQANVGDEVDKNHLKVGDLLFFDTDYNGVINHVGIYAGNGQMIDAENTYGVHFTNPFSSYWGPRFVKAMRILGTDADTSDATASNQGPATETSYTPTKTNHTTGKDYTVQSGDSLWAIATDNNTTIAALKSMNHLASDIIYPGEVLHLSTGSDMATSNPAPKPVQVSDSVKKSQSTATTYTVKAGDSLWAIGIKYDMSISDLKSLNHLKSDVIYPGQSLTISGNAASTAPAKAVQSAVQNNSVASSDYKVVGGDSLWEIATLHGTSVNKLMKANNLSSTIIYPGQNLIIPN